MLRWAVVFLIIGLSAGALGFSGSASASIGIAQILFFCFTALFLIFLVLGLGLLKTNIKTHSGGLH